MLVQFIAHGLKKNLRQGYERGDNMWSHWDIAIYYEWLFERNVACTERKRERDWSNIQRGMQRV